MTKKKNDASQSPAPRGPWAAATEFLSSRLDLSELPTGADWSQQGLSEVSKQLSEISARTGALRVPVPKGARYETGIYSGQAGRRAYRLYVPCSVVQEGAPSGLLVMLHGCGQSADECALGTGMNALAEARGVLVLYPEQDPLAHGHGCWRWFDPAHQARSQGEPAILADLTLMVRRDYAVPSAQVFVAGFSAGAAMALVLGQTHPDLFSAIGAHSGVGCGVAHDMPSALAAMAGQSQVLSRPSALKRQPPTILAQGDQDMIVSQANADRIFRDAERCLTEGAREEIEDLVRVRRRTVMSADGTFLIEDWRVRGLGHAWSGGQPVVPYTDPTSPDVSAAMIRFFLDRQV